MALEDVLEVPSYSSACPVLWKLFLLGTGNPVVPILSCVLRARRFTLSAWRDEEGRASSGDKSGAPEETHIEINLGQELCVLFFPVFFSCASFQLFQLMPSSAFFSQMPRPSPPSLFYLLSLIHLGMYKYVCCLYLQFWILLFIWYLFFANFSALLRCPNTSSIFPELWEHMLNLYSAWLKITVFVHKAKEIMCSVLLLPIQR